MSIICKCEALNWSATLSCWYQREALFNDIIIQWMPLMTVSINTGEEGSVCTVGEMWGACSFLKRCPGLWTEPKVVIADKSTVTATFAGPGHYLPLILTSRAPFQNEHAPHISLLCNWSSSPVLIDTVICIHCMMYHWTRLLWYQHDKLQINFAPSHLQMMLIYCHFCHHWPWAPETSKKDHSQHTVNTLHSWSVHHEHSMQWGHSPPCHY